MTDFPTRDPGDLATIIQRAEAGDVEAIDALFAALYAELHRLAEGHIRRNGGQITLSATIWPRWLEYLVKRSMRLKLKGTILACRLPLKSLPYSISKSRRSFNLTSRGRHSDNVLPIRKVRAAELA